MTPADALRDFCPWAEAPDARLYLRPIGLELEEGLPLAGGPLRFSRAELMLRRDDRVARRPAALSDIVAWAAARGRRDEIERLLDAVTRPRPPVAGLPVDRPLLMGIVNVTPDSFSDGGDFFDSERAIAHARAMRKAGADILDVGGESTRPGAQPLSVEAELDRVLPVIRALAAEGAAVSVDTRHAAVMQAAVEAGAALVNDITALAGDPAALAAAARHDRPVVLMHMQGEPQTMQRAPTYRDAPLDIYDFLKARVAGCAAAGIAPARLIIDPGIGFGKTVAHNLAILRHASLFHGLGCPVLFGVSRKSFIGAVSRGEPPKERLGGSLAAGLAVLDQGVQILRVHDVAASSQARAMWQALRGQAATN